MNPASTRLFRRLTGILGAGWALLAIGLSVSALFAPRGELTLPLNCSYISGAAVIESMTEEAWNTGIRNGDRLLAIDDRPVMWVLRGAQKLLSAEQPNVYSIQKRGGERLDVELVPAPREFSEQPFDVMLHVVFVMVSISYLLIGMAVWRSKPSGSDTWAMMLFCATMAVMIASAIRANLIPWSASMILANMPWIGATTFHLFTTYPVEPQWILRHPRIRAVPYAAAAAITSVVVVLEALGIPINWVSSGAFLYGVLLTFASLGVLVLERRRAHEAGVGDRADLMIMAGALSLMPAFVTLLLEHFAQLRVPWYLAIMWVIFFPVTVGYGMVRRQLFDFRIIARSSAAYGTVSLAITGLYAAIITLADAVVPQFGVNVRSVQVAFLFLAILAVYPLRDRMQRLVDTFFDRDRSQYRAALREISEAMVSMLSQREVSDRILVAVTDTMGAESAMVMIMDEDAKALTPVAWRGEWDDDHSHAEISSEHPIWKQLWMRREELARVDFDDEVDAEKREACWDVFDSLEVELLVPILFGVDLLGLIAVGRKSSGERLGADDRQLLRTLANNSAIAIENAKAFDEIAQLNETLEARVEERTRELRDTQDQLMQAEKMKSMGQLVAGVAHELNNPIGFVHANLSLLDEFIVKLEKSAEGADREKVREVIDKLLGRSLEGTNRVKDIVQNLRSFSRTDQAELQTVDLHEEIDRTIGLMEPRLKGGISIVRNYGDLPQVRCYPGQLNQVFLNLLMNACDVLPEGGTITISSERTEYGVHLRFHDEGPGIPEEVQSRIFDPFFTTKPVGKGTGLGLSLSHGIIERHRGRIQVHSSPDEGTTFDIELPLDATPDDE